MRRQFDRIVGWSAVAVLVAASLGLFAYNIWMTTARGRANVEDTRQVARGQVLYDRQCAACHGKDLKGQPNWQQSLPTGGFPAPPHDESGHTWHHPDSILFTITKSGGQVMASQGFKSNMPGFAGLLRDDEIWDVLAYIKSSWPPRIQSRQEEISRRNPG